MSLPKYEKQLDVLDTLRVKPVIEAGDIVLQLGAACDLLVGVNAVDWKGRDISRNIRVLGEENIDVNKSGVYFVDYWVIDDWGAFSKRSIKVIIK